MIPSGSHPVTPKVWGAETLIANRGFCGKRMTLFRGFRCSAHFHPVKDESFLVLSGRMLAEVGAPGMAALDKYDIDRMRRVEMHPGDSLDVPPMTLHRFTGLEDTVFVEFSTHDDPKDSLRVTESGPA